MQTIGSVPASGGTHLQDGTFEGAAYAAATDLDTAGLSDDQIQTLLDRLGRLGFAAWYRKTGYDGWQAAQLPHIHAVYADCEMKELLRLQVAAWLDGRNGLLTNTPYEFYSWSATAKQAVQVSFTASEHGTRN